MQDIELGKLIAVKEADHFSDRMTFGVPWHERRTEVEKVNGLMLINLNSDLWRRMRTMASPIFTSGKLKTMVPHINKVIVVMVCKCIDIQRSPDSAVSRLCQAEV